MNILDRTISLTLPLVPKPLVRHFSKRYIAGLRVDDALSTARRLTDAGMLTTLDILGEFITTADEARGNTDSYRELIRRIASDNVPGTNVSVKLTSLGLLLDPQLCLENMRTLLRAVEETDSFLRIDMEDSNCTSVTLDLYKTLRSEFPNRVGTVLQSYLRRTLDDVDMLSEQPTNIRLCKGIYIEPRAIAYQDREIVRRNFTLALDRLIERGAYVGIATHDEILVCEALGLIRKYGLAREQYEFQMLLGVDEQLRQILVDAGHRLRVYVPYGKHWYSYSVRRLRENPKIAGYAFKAMFRRR